MTQLLKLFVLATYFIFMITSGSCPSKAVHLYAFPHILNFLFFIHSNLTLTVSYNMRTLQSIANKKYSSKRLCEIIILLNIILRFRIIYNFNTCYSCFSIMVINAIILNESIANLLLFVKFILDHIHSHMPVCSNSLRKGKSDTVSLLT